MSVNPHGRGRFAPATLSVFADRLSRRISEDKKTPHAFKGLEVTDGVLPDGTVTQVVMLGPQRDDRRPDEKSRCILLSSDPKTSPKIVIAGEGRVLNGSISETESGLMLVRQPREGYVTRIFRTGLIMPKNARNSKEARAHRQRDLAELRVAGIKLGYHGIFPLELGSAQIGASGETVEVMQVADVYDLSDEKARKLKGIDVPESREMGAEIPIGGAVLCGDLGFLTVHERTSRETIKIWDVSDDKTMWARFQEYARQDLERRLAAQAN